jgi:hypothetical protein
LDTCQWTIRAASSCFAMRSLHKPGVDSFTIAPAQRCQLAVTIWELAPLLVTSPFLNIFRLPPQPRGCPAACLDSAFPETPQPTRPPTTNVLLEVPFLRLLPPLLLQTLQFRTQTGGGAARKRRAIPTATMRSPSAITVMLGSGPRPVASSAVTRLITSAGEISSFPFGRQSIPRSQTRSMRFLQTIMARH